MLRYFPATFLKVNTKIFLCLVVLVLHVFSCFAQIEGPPRLRTIVIDPGHGGKDPGAVSRVGKKVVGKEKDVVLSVGLKLGEYIKKHFKDIKVVYTRETDVFIELHKRASIANKCKADLFISIHCNSSKKTEPYGSETYVMGIHKTQGNLEVAMLENSVVLKEQNYTQEYDGVDPNSQEAYIIFNMLQNAHLSQSLSFAAKVQDQFTGTLGRDNRGVKQAVFFVLWKTVMPSVLIEAGFISNKEESEYLLNESAQQLMAYAIFNALRSYRNELEGIKDDGIIIEKPQFIAEKKNESEKNQVEQAKEEKSNISSTAQDSTSQNTQVQDGIIFRIQITASKVKIAKNSEVFKGLSVEEIAGDGVYKYTVCSSKSYKEIEGLQKLIRADFPDSFIIAFKNGKKIPTSDAIKEIKN